MSDVNVKNIYVKTQEFESEHHLVGYKFHSLIRTHFYSAQETCVQKLRGQNCEIWLLALCFWLAYSVSYLLSLVSHVYYESFLCKRDYACWRNLCQKLVSMHHAHNKNCAVWLVGCIWKFLVLETCTESSCVLFGASFLYKFLYSGTSPVSHWAMHNWLMVCPPKGSRPREQRWSPRGRGLGLEDPWGQLMMAFALKIQSLALASDAKS